MICIFGKPFDSHLRGGWKAVFLRSIRVVVTRHTGSSCTACFKGVKYPLVQISCELPCCAAKPQLQQCSASTLSAPNLHCIVLLFVCGAATVGLHLSGASTAQRLSTACLSVMRIKRTAPLGTQFVTCEDESMLSGHACGHCCCDMVQVVAEHPAGSQQGSWGTVLMAAFPCSLLPYTGRQQGLPALTALGHVC